MDVEGVKTSQLDEDVKPSDPQQEKKEEREIKMFSQESIDHVVDRFSELYGVDVEKEKTNYNIFYLDHEVLDENFGAQLAKEYIGMDIKISKEEVQSVLKRQNQLGGEWIRSRNFGIVFSSVKENYGEEGVNRAISHEVVHALGSSHGGEFVGGSLTERLMSGKIEAFEPRLKDLNEGVTEVLSLGIYLNTTDIEVLREDIMKRVNKGLEQKSTEGILLPYLSQVKDVLVILEKGGVTLPELAEYYMKGDYNGLGKQARENVKKSDEEIRGMSDDEFKEFSKYEGTLFNSLQNMGIRFEYK